MKIDISHIIERNHISASFCVPLRLTRLGPDDMADHMEKIRPLLAGMVDSPRDRARAMEECWERFNGTFRWN